MSTDSWWHKILPSFGAEEDAAKKNNIPEGLWQKCPSCDTVLYQPELDKNAMVCTKCHHHFPISARERLLMVLDDRSADELFAHMKSDDKLKFKDSKRYKDRLATAQKCSGETDALLAMRGEIKSLPVIALAFEFKFLGGSMGSVVGSKFTAAAELALKEQVPLICFSASGGARMQEALFSLMQMAKTSAIIEKMKAAGVPYISVLTHPSYGGVTASLATLGDINIGEPKAMIGFAGPRVIKQTVRQDLPEGFQRSEFLMDHGMLDMIVSRHEMRDTLKRLLNSLTAHLQVSKQLASESEEQVVIDANADNA